MDELTMVGDYLTEERPASVQTVAAARRRLTGEIAKRPRQRLLGGRRLRVAVVAVATAGVTVLAAGGYQAWRTRPLYHPEPLAGQSGPASDFLLAAADAKTRHTSEGRLWYVHTVNAYVGVVRSAHEPGVRYRVEISHGSYVLAAKTENGLDEGVSSQGWEDQPEQIEVRPVSAADRAAWIRDRRPDAEALGLTVIDPYAPPRVEGEKPDDPRRGPLQREGAVPDFGVKDARRLPTDPAKLRAWLLNYATKFDHKRLRDPDLYLFTTASALLIDAPVSDRVRIAVYRILAALDNVRMVTATDAQGRTGRAVAMRETTAKYGTVEWQLFIDPSTGQLTASQGVVIQPGTANAQLPPGSRQFSEVVKNAEWTNTSPDKLKPAWILDMERRYREQHAGN